ncbi:MAG: hypothetical protein BGO78_12715 [Chloroflexi bacterium 44-23]|nr:MAG: hypothetical protein BGO78_12715 [Chloroflexi bacterium 44-23]
MKRAVSVSIGSSKRDKQVTFDLLGQTISLERIGTDGDMQKAANLYKELDGQVGALGVGGAVLGLLVDQDWYDFHSILPLVKDVKQTPVVDGTGLKDTVERQAADVVAPLLNGQPKRVFQMSGVDRYGLARGFTDSGYEQIYGDLLFSIGLPIPIRSDASLKRMTKLLAPILSRFPFSWLYPTGEKQEHNKPKYSQYFDWASVISGDCHYITKYMPASLQGKIVVTNTTTPKDREIFKASGVRYLITTTPMLDGRSFGTNMIEAAILTAWDWKEPVHYGHPGNYFEKMQAVVAQLGLHPTIQEL